MAQAPPTSSSRIQRRLWKAGRLERQKSVPETRVPVRATSQSDSYCESGL